MAILVKFSDVLRMLDNCAKGYTWRLATHSRVIQFNGRTFRTLPKFDELEDGYIRKVVRHLQIDEECAAQYVGQAIRKKKATTGADR